MFDFGDDIILQSYSLPWLLWIQIVIMFLLTLSILLSYFDFFALDSSSHLGYHPICSQASQIDAITGCRTSGIENNAEKDRSSEKALTSAPNAKYIYHPCRFFDLAKQAFLKCLGLGSRSPNPTDKQHEHED